jgi:hypothetical protein
MALALLDGSVCTRAVQKAPTGVDYDSAGATTVKRLFK